MEELNYKYTDFNVEPRSIGFEGTDKGGIFISIPRADDSPILQR